ncbi:MAG: glycosyltransferase [Minisyncoccota bacterium]
MNDTQFSIIIPAYNEAKRIDVTLQSIGNYFKNKTVSYEVIVVDDASTDDTVSVVREFSRTIPNIEVIENKKNQGKGACVKQGMRRAQGAYRLFMDADNSVDISHLDTFFTHIQNGADIVIGSIALRGAEINERSGRHRRFLGNLAKRLIQVVAVPGIEDTQRGFKLFSAYAADVIFPKQTISRFGFDIEILLIAWLNGFSIQELPVVWDNPDGSKVTLASYVTTLKELARTAYNRLRGVYAPGGYHFFRARNVIHAGLESSLVRRERRRQARALWTGYAPQTLSSGHLQITPQGHPRGNLRGDPLVYLSDSQGRREGFSYKGDHFVHHSELHHHETAFFNLLRHQKLFLALSAGFLGLVFLVNWQVSLIVAFSLLTALYFMDLLFNAFITYRTFRVRPEITVTPEEIATRDQHAWPSYTIFCPLYKEWQVVPQFVDAMQKLEYPKDKLQIMFLLEEDDTETVEKIKAANLPAHFEIVVIPHSKPKTKPKAMNYGLKYARGEYLVIYDAEDIPEPDQLKKAVIALENVGNDVACVQAKLNFYNPKQNVLTRIFTAEYSLWFDLILPGLQSISAPIPLGGTSNHFRIDVLRLVSGWDAFNVTEDCDLGMRLSRRGFRTAIIESTTHEEANSDVINWYKQRSRWIKGYIQTYFVHMRSPRALVREGKGRDLFLFQLIVGGKVASLFINPIMWVITIIYFTFRSTAGVFIESLFPGPILYIGVFSLIFGNFLYLYYYMVGCAKRGYYDLIKYVFFVPLYWLGMSIAAWRAAYEVVVRPHYWYKTEHGLHLTETISALEMKPLSLTYYE